jgi:hypothetical protein
MVAIAQKNLFSWDAIDARSDLDRLRVVIDHLRDERLVQYLEVMPGHGRDDYPVRAVPSSWNVSRFLANVIALEETLGMISEMTVLLREQLLAVLPDFGLFGIRHLGFDGTDIASHSTGQKARTSGETSDPDADWGHHETHGIDARTAKAWKKLKRWFGDGLHLIADTQYELPVAFELKPASASEQATQREMIRATFAETPALAARCHDFSADRGLDSAETKALLRDDDAIRPLIDTRELWREEKNLPDYDPATLPNRVVRPFRCLVVSLCRLDCSRAAGSGGGNARQRKCLSTLTLTNAADLRALETTLSFSGTQYALVSATKDETSENFTLPKKGPRGTLVKGKWRQARIKN